MKENFINLNEIQELKDSISKKKEESLRINLSGEDTIEDKKKYYYNRLFKECCRLDRYKNSNLTNFNIKKDSKVYEYISKFFENLESGIGLILCGNVGNGKTRLSFAIVRLYLEVFNKFDSFEEPKKPERVKYIELFKHLWDKVKGQDYWKKYRNCDLLIIDDFLAKDSSSKGYQETLNELLDYRYENCKSTIFTANFGANELKELLSVRTYDRIINTNHVIEIKAKSRRSEFDKLNLEEL